MANKKIYPKSNNGYAKMKIKNGSHIGIIGGGPAGSLFNYFILDIANRLGIDIQVDIYDGKDFCKFGPAGCNHCGGIISESLVQILATEGINIPEKVVQRGIDSYVLHMDIGSVRIETPLQEKRIAAVYRGSGPLGTKELSWESFDKFLLDLAIKKGTNFINDRVTVIKFEDERPQIKTQKGLVKSYDLIVGAAGVNSTALNLFNGLEFGFQPPSTTKTFICEFLIGHDMVKKHFGNSMHVFLLDIPRLEFAALIPKGENVTLVLLGREIDKELVQSFLNAHQVKQLFPSEIELSAAYSCQCYPKINIKSAVKPYADRVVLIGDCATSKLYKNGIGAAYVAARAAASTAMLHGISAKDFERYYWPACKKISNDNTIGKLIFFFTTFVKKRRIIKRGILRMVSQEQHKEGKKRRMSTVLWDTFTGSAPYSDILVRTLNPLFSIRLIMETAKILMPFTKENEGEQHNSEKSNLGKWYKNGEIIVHEGDEGDCMFVIQKGRVEVFQFREEKEIKIAELGVEDFFGEMALFDKSTRSTSVRAKGDVCVLTIDRKGLFRTIQDNPSLVFRLIERMSHRMRAINNQISRIRASDRRNWDMRPVESPEIYLKRR